MGFFDKFKTYVSKPYNTYAETTEKNDDGLVRNSGVGNAVAGAMPMVNDALSAPVEKKVEKPKTPTVDPSDLEDAELLGALAPMSKEEQEKRAQRSSAVNGIGHFTRALGALGNVLGVNSGAPHIKVDEYKGSDVDAFNDKVWNQRSKYLGVKQSVENARMAREKKKSDMDVAEAKADAYISNMEKRNEKIDNDIKLSQARYEYQEAQAMLARAKAEGYPMELQMKLQNMLNMMQTRLMNANTNAFRAQTAASQGEQRLGIQQQNANTSQYRAEVQNANNAANAANNGVAYNGPAAVGNQQVVAQAPAAAPAASSARNRNTANNQSGKTKINW